MATNRIGQLFRERNMQADTAHDAAQRGFPGAAGKARAEVERLEREIKAEQAANAPATWSTEAHP